MSDPLHNAPDNPFQPPAPPTAPPTAPLDTPVTGAGAGYGAPTYTTAGQGTSSETTGSAEQAKANAGEVASDAKEKAGDVAATAKDKAGDVASAASDHASAVAQTAQEKGREVVNEATNQAQSLLGQVKAQLQQQTQQGHENARSGLQGLAEELSSMIDGHGGTGGPATQLATQARDRVSELSGWLDARDPGDLVNEVRDFARRKPGTFLVGALLAGVAVGRLTRGAVDAHRSDGDTGSSQEIATTDTYAAAGSVGGGSYGGAEYGAAPTEEFVVTSGYPSGATTGADYPSTETLAPQSEGLPSAPSGTGGSLAADEPTIGYSAPPSGGVTR